MLIPLLALAGSILASFGLAIDIPNQSEFIIKHVESCSSVGYFFKLDLPNSLTPGICYVCFCQDKHRAVCWRRDGIRCKAESYHHYWLGNRHTSRPNQWFTTTGATVPQQLKSTSKSLPMNTELVAVGNENMLEEAAESIKNDTENSPPSLNRALTANGYEKLVKGYLDSVQKQQRLKKVKEPGNLEALTSLNKLRREMNHPPQFHEETVEEPAFLEKAPSFFGYRKFNVKVQKFPKKEVARLSVLAETMSATKFGKVSDEKPEINPPRRRKRSPSLTVKTQKKSRITAPRSNKTKKNNGRKATTKNFTVTKKNNKKQDKHRSNEKLSPHKSKIIQAARKKESRKQTKKIKKQKNKTKSRPKRSLTTTVTLHNQDSQNKSYHKSVLKPPRDKKRDDRGSTVTPCSNKKKPLSVSVSKKKQGETLKSTLVKENSKAQVSIAKNNKKKKDQIFKVKQNMLQINNKKIVSNRKRKRMTNVNINVNKHKKRFKRFTFGEITTIKPDTSNVSKEVLPMMLVQLLPTTASHQFVLDITTQNSITNQGKDIDTATKNISTTLVSNIDNSKDYKQLSKNSNLDSIACPNNKTKCISSYEKIAKTNSTTTTYTQNKTASISKKKSSADSTFEKGVKLDKGTRARTNFEIRVKPDINITRGDTNIGTRTTFTQNKTTNYYENKTSAGPDFEKRVKPCNKTRTNLDNEKRNSTIKGTTQNTKKIKTDDTRINESHTTSATYASTQFKENFTTEPINPISIQNNVQNKLCQQTTVNNSIFVNSTMRSVLMYPEIKIPTVVETTEVQEINFASNKTSYVPNMNVTVIPNDVIKIITDNSSTTLHYNITEPRPKTYRKHVNKKIGGERRRKIKKLIKTLKNKSWKNRILSDMVMNSAIPYNAKNIIYNITPNQNTYKTTTVTDAKKVFNKLIQEFREKNDSNNGFRPKTNNAIKYLWKLLRKLLGKGDFGEALNNVSRIDFERKRIIETLCETFGACNVETLKNPKLLNKIDNLYEKMYDMINIINTIKGLLSVVQFSKYDRNLTNTSCHRKHNTQRFKHDIHKLHSILKGTHLEENNLTMITSTQARQIDDIKASVKTFVRCTGEFSNLLNEIINITVPHPTKNSKKRGFKESSFLDYNIDSDSRIKKPLTKLKDLIIRYNEMQSEFMNKLLNAIVNMKTNSSKNYDGSNDRVDKGYKSNDKYENILMHGKNIIEILRKLKFLAQRLDTKNNIKNHVVRRKRDLRDDEMEYVLLLTEYLLKRQSQPNFPASDGIDLIIEAIKNAPPINYTPTTYSTAIKFSPVIKPTYKKTFRDVKSFITTDRALKRSSLKIDYDISDINKMTNDNSLGKRKLVRNKKKHIKTADTNKHPVIQYTPVQPLDDDENDEEFLTEDLEANTSPAYSFVKDEIVDELNHGTLSPLMEFPVMHDISTETPNHPRKVLNENLKDMDLNSFLSHYKNERVEDLHEGRNAMGSSKKRYYIEKHSPKILKVRDPTKPHTRTQPTYPKLDTSNLGELLEYTSNYIYETGHVPMKKIDLDHKYDYRPEINNADTKVQYHKDDGKKGSVRTIDGDIHKKNLVGLKSYPTTTTMRSRDASRPRLIYFESEDGHAIQIKNNKANTEQHEKSKKKKTLVSFISNKNTTNYRRVNFVTKEARGKKHRNEDVLKKKEVDLHNSLDYGQDQTMGDDDIETEEEIEDNVGEEV